MADETEIQWATSTFNPWEGCTKVSPGCANCYAEARNRRFSKGVNWGKGKPRRRTSAANWKKPLVWNRSLVFDELRDSDDGFTTRTRRKRVFPSLCDWLDDEVPIEWLADFLKLIHDTPNLAWLLLTKRPENFLLPLMARVLDFVGKREGFPKRGKPSAFGDWLVKWVEGSQCPENVWPGVSVEDQPRADERIPELLKIPAKVRFLSVEPLIAPVMLPVHSNFAAGHRWLGDSDCSACIDWVIVGGESGPGARPCNVEWIRDIVSQCKAAGVPCFVKQLGSYPVSEILDARGHHVGTQCLELSHKKGGDPSEWPVCLRVREFPRL